MDVKELFEKIEAQFDADAAGDRELKVNCVVDGVGTWCVNVADGSCSVEEGEADDATATMEADEETWVGIYDKSVDGTTAFMTGKIRIQGNMGDILKMQKVFGLM